MSGIALVRFIALFAFRERLVGRHDLSGEVQLGLFASFLFGLVFGYRNKS
jgi:hypothetical protein